MNHLFIHTVDVQRLVVTPDDEGGSDKSYDDVYSSVKCWIAKHEGMESIESFGGSENFAFEMTTMQTGLLEGDVITWENKRFIIKKMQTANTSRGVHHYVLTLEEMK